MNRSVQVLIWTVATVPARMFCVVALILMYQADGVYGPRSLSPRRWVIDGDRTSVDVPCPSVVTLKFWAYVTVKRALNGVVLTGLSPRRSLLRQGAWLMPSETCWVVPANV